MDFKRIQIILIITFSVLNLYLLTVILEKDKELNFGDPSTVVRLEEGMRNDNIQAPELSNESIRMPIVKADKTNYLAENMESLSNQTTRMENSKLISTLTTPIEINMEEELSLQERLLPIDVFMQMGNVLKAEEYEFLTYQETNSRVIYVQHASDYPIADGTGSLVFHLNGNGEITSYEQTYMGVPEVQGRNRAVISEQAAVEALYLNNQIPNNSTLRTITLTYYQTLSLQDMNIYSPMWYVEIVRDNVPIQVKHVDGLTGNLITAPSLSNPEGSPEEDESADMNGESGAEDTSMMELQLNNTEGNFEPSSERVLIAE